VGALSIRFRAFASFVRRRPRQSLLRSGADIMVKPDGVQRGLVRALICVFWVTCNMLCKKHVILYSRSAELSRHPLNLQCTRQRQGRLHNGATLWWSRDGV